MMSGVLLSSYVFWEPVGVILTSPFRVLFHHFRDVFQVPLLPSTSRLPNTHSLLWKLVFLPLSL